jgi:hypothetical protein
VLRPIAGEDGDSRLAAVRMGLVQSDGATKKEWEIMGPTPLKQRSNLTSKREQATIASQTNRPLHIRATIPPLCLPLCLILDNTVRAEKHNAREESFIDSLLCTRTGPCAFV